MARVWARGRAPRHRAGWPARLAVLAGLAIVLFGLAAPPVGANYGRVSARITCDRTVTWTASASSEGSDEDRTNRRVLVERRATRGQEPLEEWTPAGPEGSFDAVGGFEFSGSFRLPEGADSVDLRVTPLEPWGTRADGDPPGAPRFSRAELPEGCDQQPVVATVTGDCAAGGALVELRNTGEHPHAATVASDGVPVREVRLEPAGTAELVVPLLEGRPSDVRVSSGDFVVAEATVEPDCGLDGPAAVVLERCAARQAVVHARAGSPPASEVAIRLGDSIVHRAAMSPERLVQRTLELPPAGAVTVAVELDGTTVATGAVGGCDGPVAGAVTCGVGDRPACDAVAGTTATTLPPPPPPPPPAVVELDPAQPLLPRTGPWERAVVLVLGGGLLLAGGLAAVGRDRARPAPSPIGSALAPYRQRWWDDR